VAACYAGAPIAEWGSGHEAGAILQIDFSATDGIRVTTQPI
jgi:hypothetical protein